MILITGASGCLGGEVLSELLKVYPQKEFGLVLRSRRGAQAPERYKSLLRCLALSDPHHSDRISCYASDLESDSLENAPCTDGTGTLARKLPHLEAIFHCAASTNLSQDWEAARRINFDATKKLLDLAATINSPQLQFHYVSTAYVMGAKNGVVLPTELNLELNFRNSYERSKAQAEAAVRSYASRFRVVIYRPSIIVGDSRTGRTSTFENLYILARFVARGLVDHIPALPVASLDLVPVDYVAKAIAALSCAMHPSGSCFHLSAGAGREPTIYQVAEELVRACVRIGTPRPMPHFLPDPPRRPVRASLLEQARPFFPYLTGSTQFDTTATRAALCGKLAEPSLFSAYADKIFDYCLTTDWGKRLSRVADVSGV